MRAVPLRRVFNPCGAAAGGISRRESALALGSRPDLQEWPKTAVSPFGLARSSHGSRRTAMRKPKHFKALALRVV
jgi:hypothetical protein